MFSNHTFPGNCGMCVLYNLFLRGGKYKAPSDTSIRRALKAALDAQADPSMVAFSGAKFQEAYTWGPQQFAAWLRKKGEKVTSTAYVLNHGTESKIKAYYWSPSLKFRKKFGMYCAVD